MIQTDLSPRYPKPRPLTLYEEWAALLSRLTTVEACIKVPVRRLRLYADCQARYDALLALADRPPHPAEFRPPPFSEVICPFCGRPFDLFKGALPVLAGPGAPADTPVVPACGICVDRYAGKDPLPAIAQAGQTPSLVLARAYLGALYAYAWHAGLLQRLYLLDLLQPHYRHPLALDALDYSFAFLATYFRTRGRLHNLRLF